MELNLVQELCSKKKLPTNILFLVLCVFSVYAFDFTVVRLKWGVLRYMAIHVIKSLQVAYVKI